MPEENETNDGDPAKAGEVQDTVDVGAGTPPPADAAAGDTDFLKPDPSVKPGDAVLAGGFGEKTWGMIAHLSTLLAYTGLGFMGASVIAPLIVWLVFKDKSAFVNDQGKEAVNFNITMLIATVVVTAIAFMSCGFGGFLYIPLLIVHVVFTIIAAVKTNEGVAYRYPAILRLVK